MFLGSRRLLLDYDGNWSGAQSLDGVQTLYFPPVFINPDSGNDVSNANSAFAVLVALSTGGVFQVGGTPAQLGFTVQGSLDRPDTSGSDWMDRLWVDLATRSYNVPLPFRRTDLAPLDLGDAGGKTVALPWMRLVGRYTPSDDYSLSSVKIKAWLGSSDSLSTRRARTPIS